MGATKYILKAVSKEKRQVKECGYSRGHGLTWREGENQPAVESVSALKDKREFAVF